ncbi:hypothetical protein ACOSZF_11755 [Cytobacillus firmus]|uniref:hypothetical protein n=1 Tax=Cytobacillus firmus TaxID=1399 RepID=UPI003BA0DF21
MKINYQTILILVGFVLFIISFTVLRDSNYREYLQIAGGALIASVFIFGSDKEKVKKKD